MFKNTASQKLTLFAFDYTTGAPKTGDAANLTAYVAKDDGAVTALGDTSAAELDATNARGWYSFDLTQAETNADKLLFTAKSATANVSVVGLLVYTRAANSGNLVISVAGVLDVNVLRWAGTFVGLTGSSLPAVEATAANLTQINFASGPVANLEDFFDGTGYDAANSRVGAVTSVDQTASIGANGIQAVSIASNAITAAKIATDAITAAKLAADAVAEIQSGLATAAALTVVDDFLDTEVAAILAAVDTEVAAIKAKTDSLTFTVAGVLDANCQYVNDVQVVGTGASGSEWGPAP